MCEYGKQCKCNDCNDAIKEDGFVAGCIIQEEIQRLEDERLIAYMSSLEEDDA